jgi:hypothetical protein
MISLIALVSGLVSAQSARPKYLDHALIQHVDSDVTVQANDPLPLLQAISDLRLEYGWRINWEWAPAYSHFDLVDATDPKWRAAHPGEKGATRPAGGLFTATFPEPKEASDTGAERDALARLVDEYNATDNPGKYVLRVDADGQFTVVGTRIRDETGALQEIQPLLDTPVTLAKAPRNVYDTIESILGALQSVTGKKVLFAVASSSLFINTQANMGGQRILARDLLKQAFASTKRPLQYDLCLNSDAPVYLLNVSLTMKAEEDGLGGRRLIPVDRSKP